MMLKTSTFTLIFLTTAIGAEADKAIKNLWGETTESSFESVLQYAPRLMGYTFEDIITSRLSQRAAKTIIGTARLPFDPTKSAYELSDGLSNIPGVIHDAVSDTVGLIKNVNYASYPKTSRIRLCSSNLVSNLTSEVTPMHLVNPMLHLGVVIDEKLYETTDSLAGRYELRDQVEKGGLVCHNIPIKSYEPVNLAIERLMCIDRGFEQSYDFLGYNCGGYTRDVLLMAGLGYPQAINWGVGSEFTIPRHAEDYKSNRAQIRKKCDDHIKNIRSMITKLNKGIRPSKELRSILSTNTEIGMGLFFQLLILKNKVNNFDLSPVLKRFKELDELTELILNSKGEIRQRYRYLFQNLIKTIPKSGQIYDSRYDQAYKILDLAKDTLTKNP